MATSAQATNVCRRTITTDDEIARLVIETAKYHSAGVGNTVPVGEVRAQASANGYTDDETDDMLADAGLRAADVVVVPPQGNLFGDLWAVGADESLAGPEIEEGVESEPGPVERFRAWLEEKSEDDGETARHASHAYTFRGARKKYARAKDVDRWFSEHYGTFSTVLISLCARRQPAETLAEHARRFYPEELTRKTYYELNKLGVTDEYAGIRLLSPKTIPENRLPRAIPSNSGATTHAHTCLWIPGEVWPADFRGVVEKHVETVDGATTALHPFTDAVSVRTHDSEHLRMSNTNQDGRAPTTALPGEIGDNLPLLSTEYDGEGLPEWGIKWAAHLRLGTDDSLDTRGTKRWRPLGAFNDCADEYKDTREED